MNATENVRRAFRSKYSFDVQPAWLHACLAWLRDQFQLADLTSTYTLEKVYNQWLHTDLALVADASSLPNDLDLNAKKVQLTGRYALQVLPLPFALLRTEVIRPLGRSTVSSAYQSRTTVKYWIFTVIRTRTNGSTRTRRTRNNGK